MTQQEETKTYIESAALSEEPRDSEKKPPKQHTAQTPACPSHQPTPQSSRPAQLK
ncbi:hypothetical protein CHS0354_009434, partial [Potamilus streckersoni]